MSPRPIFQVPRYDGGALSLARALLQKHRIRLLVVGLIAFSYCFFPIGLVSPTAVAVHGSRAPSLTEGEIRLSEGQIRLSSVIDSVEASVQRSIDAFDQRAAQKEWGLDLRPGPGSGPSAKLSRESYEESLRQYWDEFFVPPPLDWDDDGRNRSQSEAEPEPEPLKNKQVDIDEILSHLSLLQTEQVRILATSASEGSKTIFTTFLSDMSEVSDQFKSWTTKNRDWTVRTVSDADIDVWIKQVLDGTRVVQEMEALRKSWGVVRADLFRYLILLLNGGVYSDTDTACVRPISTWAAGAVRHRSPIPLMEALPDLIPLAEADSEGREQGSEGSEDSIASRALAAEDEPSMIVALETDAMATHANWRQDTFVRGLQVVQWTILAKKGHPILLDTLGHALRTARDVREKTERGETVDIDILNWSGPGVFTDAILRYLLVRYGVHPSELSGLAHPLRIGDVVIMPVHSFRADASEGFQGENTVVWHGFFGRWKTGSE